MTNRPSKGIGFTRPVTGIASLLKISYNTVLRGILFQGLAVTLYFLFGGFIFFQDRALRKTNRPSKGIELTQPATGKVSLVKKIGHVV